MQSKQPFDKEHLIIEQIDRLFLCVGRRDKDKPVCIFEDHKGKSQ